MTSITIEHARALDRIKMIPQNTGSISWRLISNWNNMGGVYSRTFDSSYFLFIPVDGVNYDLNAWLWVRGGGVFQV
jgi:hypothetical protein